MTKPTTRQELVEAVIESYAEYSMKKGTGLSGSEIQNLKDAVQEAVDQAHTAGRNAEREELREWVEDRFYERDYDLEKANNSVTGWNQALTDIKNHLTE